MANPSKGEETWTSSIFGKLLGSPSSTGTNQQSQPNLSQDVTKTQVPEAKAPSPPIQTGPHLKNIRTPHQPSSSHPELAFSPTDIGIWECTREPRKMDGKAPSEGFSSWGQWFGSGK